MKMIVNLVESLEQETENDEVVEETRRAPARRTSQRQVTKPKYLEDYILLTKEEGEKLLMCLNDEPRDFDEAKNSKAWRLACDDEIHSIIKNQTWNFVDLPDGEKLIGLKWVSNTCSREATMCMCFF